MNHTADLVSSQQDASFISSSLSPSSLEQPHSPLDGTRDDNCDPPASKRLALEPSGHCDDAAQFISTHSTSAERYYLLTNHFCPPPDYSFPKGEKGRTFQHRWLQVFPWLVYSKQVNGGYCLPCILFASTGYQGSTPGVLVNRPLTAFNKALELLRKHADKEHHKAAVVRADEFKKTMSNQQPSIQIRLNRALAERVAINRQKLESIMKTVVLCGRQNIAMRGHRDSVADLERDVSGSDNHGNFLALLHFRIEAGDTVLGEHLSTAARNATYISNTAQNQIINVLADQVRQKIIQKVQAAKWYAVIADEVTDVSNKEQLSIVLRYVDSDSLVIREDLVDFTECDTGISRQNLADKITSSLEA